MCGSSTLDVSTGGVFRGSTCGCNDDVVPCDAQPPGRPEAQFQITVPPGEWSCKVTFAEGLSYAIFGRTVPGVCGTETGDYDHSLPIEELPGVLFGGGATGNTYQIAIETFYESCGDYEMEVHCSQVIGDLI